MKENEHITLCSTTNKKVETFSNLGAIPTNQNVIQEEIKCRIKT